MRSRKELADAIRILSMDAVDKAKSGHPGAPMGMFWETSTTVMAVWIRTRPRKREILSWKERIHSYPGGISIPRSGQMWEMRSSTRPETRFP